MCVCLSVYNYKALENAIAPNVALPQMKKGASPCFHSDEGRSRKRRTTGEGHHTPPKVVSAKTRDSDVEVREEGEFSSRHLYPFSISLVNPSVSSTASLSSLSSPSFTSSSSSAKDLSSPGVAAEANPTPATSPPEVSASTAPLDPELEALKQALDGGLDSLQDKGKFLHEMVKMRVKQEEKLGTALQAKRSLQQVNAQWGHAHSPKDAIGKS